MGIPILGICYGLQLICDFFRGIVDASSIREFGKANIKLVAPSDLIEGIYKNNKKYQVWMSHSDTLTKLPKGFEVVASSEDSKFAMIKNLK